MPETSARAEELFNQARQSVYTRTDRIFAYFLALQWGVAVLLGLLVAPYTWVAETSRQNPHTWLAITAATVIVSLPIGLAHFRPGSAMTRHVIAAAQMLMSGIFVHLTGGRIETHFHYFGSLAFLSFYRDTRILLTAAAVAGGDHFLRGVFWPYSFFGAAYVSQWRWLEHVMWVVFEESFLIIAIRQSLGEMLRIAGRQAALEKSMATVEEQVQERTLELQQEVTVRQTAEQNLRTLAEELEQNNLQLEMSRAALEALSLKDELTGLYNRRYFNAICTKEFQRAVRYKRVFSLLMLDVDRFKEINDTHGHQVGDQVLKMVSSQCVAAVRKSDYVIRYGGEEVLVILPETCEEAACSLAERIRLRVEAERVPLETGKCRFVAATVSIGVAAYPAHAKKLDDLLAAADKALYTAKREGRNLVRKAGVIQGEKR